MRGMTHAGAWFAGGLGVLLMSGMAWSVLQRSPGVDAEAAPVPTAPQRAAASAPAVTALPMSAASLARMAEQANAELAQLNIAAQAGDQLGAVAQGLMVLQLLQLQGQPLMAGHQHLRQLAGVAVAPVHQALVKAFQFLGQIAHRADFGHARLHAGTRLQRALAVVEGIAWGVHGDQARRPTGLTGIATKPGSASTRASQARTFG